MPSIVITMSRKDLDDLGDAFFGIANNGQVPTRAAKDALVVSELTEFVRAPAVNFAWQKEKEKIPKPPAPSVNVVIQP